MFPSAEGYVTTVGPVGHFDAPIIPFSRVVRPWAHGYLVSSENINSIMAPGKCDYSSGM